MLEDKGHISIYNYLLSWCFSKNISILSVIIFLIDISAITIYKADTLFTFFLSYLILMIINTLFLKVPKQFMTFVYLIVVGLALVMIISNSINIPNFLGMTDALDGGTDDAFYFIQATLGTNNKAASIIPTIRYDAYSVDRLTIFSKILHLWVLLINPVVNVYPIDILFFNVIIICIYNIACIYFCINITDDYRCVATIIPLLLFCPFMFSNGLLILRDIVVACCFVVASNCILKWKIKTLIISVVCLALLRPAAIVEFAIMAWFMLLVSDHLKLDSKKTRHITFWILVTAIIILVALNNVSTITRYMSQLSGGVRTFVLDAGDENSTITKFYHLPALLRILLMSFYYFIMPTFNVKSFYNHNIFVIRDGYYSIFGLINLILLPRYINGFVYSIWHDKDKRMKYIAMLYIIMMIFVSQLSTVGRHKTGFVFLYYTVSVYGKYHYTNNSRIIGYICSGVLCSFYFMKSFVLN
jgi:hypothetical protein